MLLIGIALALFFWIFKSILLFLATGQLDWGTHLLGKDIYHLYDRLAVVALFIFFGSHAQFNIKKRRKAEMALQGSEDRYRSILESIEEGYYEIDLGYQTQFFNDSCTFIMSCPRYELIGMDFRKALTEKSARQLERSFSEILSTGRPANNLEFELSARGGFHRIVELSASVITNAMQRPTGFRGIVRDVTEKRMLERKVIESLKNVKDARTGAILGLAKLAEYRDNDTGRHLERIREYTKVLAEELTKSPTYAAYITNDYIEDLYHSSILHDIGKVGIQDSILLKPGKLTPEEYEVMKNHAILGGNALAAVDAHIQGQSFLTIGKEIAYYHHEKWDGSGYPNGLKNNEIPQSARMVALADVYDAITSKRCYKVAYSHQVAKEIIESERGRAFDPDVVDAFLANEQRFHRIHEELHS
jgi:PAS domain S-box-containing protein